MGNICRSPAAEGILKHLVKKDSTLNVYVESCGIGDWHVGRSPDHRMQAASTGRGIPLTSKAQQFQKQFFHDFDYILAADKEILRDLTHYATTAEDKGKLFLMTEFSEHYKHEPIPDPYYGGEKGFELVLDMLEDCCKGLLKHIERRRN